MSKITQYVRHLAVVAIATLLAQCAWAVDGLNYTWRSGWDADPAQTVSYSNYTGENGILFAGQQMGIVAQVKLVSNVSANIINFGGDNRVVLATDADGKYTLSSNIAALNGHASETAATTGWHRYSMFVRRGVNGSGHAASVIVYEDGNVIFKITDGSFVTGPFRNLTIGGKQGNLAKGGHWSAHLSAGAATADEATAAAVEADCVKMYPPVDETIVAKIGETGYQTLDAAMAYATEHATAEAPIAVKLLAVHTGDVTIPENVTIEMTTDNRIVGAISGAGTVKLSHSSTATQGSLATWIGEGKMTIDEFTGTVHLAAGRFNVTDALVPATAKVKVTNGAQLFLDGGTWTNTIELEGAGYGSETGAIGRAALRFENGNIDGATIVTTGTGDNAPAIGSHNSDRTFACAISGSGDLRLVLGTGAHTYQLTNNSFTGALTIVDANLTVKGAFTNNAIKGAGTYSIALANANTSARINTLFTEGQLADFTGKLLMTQGRFEFASGNETLIPSAVMLATSNQGKIYLGSGEWNNHFVIAGNGWTGDGSYKMGPVALRVDNATFGENASIQAVVESNVVPAIGIYNTNPTLCAITGNGGLRLRSHNAQTITISAANLSGLSGAINLVDANVTLEITAAEAATVANDISGSGKIKKSGEGALTLSGAVSCAVKLATGTIVSETVTGTVTTDVAGKKVVYSDGTYSLVELTALEKLLAAIEVASVGATVTATGDIELGNNEYIGKAVTIDLGNNTMTVTADASGIMFGATITNGSIVKNGTGSIQFVPGTTATITLNAGSVSVVNGELAVEPGNADKVVDEATYGQMKYYSLTDPTPAELTFTLGTLPDHVVAMVYVGTSVVDASSGSFNAAVGDRVVIYYAYEEGYIGDQILSAQFDVVEGMQTTISAPGATAHKVTAVVIKGEDEKEYASIVDAIAKGNGGTVALRDDLELGSAAPIKIPSGVEIAINFNGHTISRTTSSNYVLDIAGGAEVILADGTEAGNGGLKGTPVASGNTKDPASLIRNKGNLTILSGVYTSDYTVVKNDEDPGKGVLIVEGGTLEIIPNDKGYTGLTFAIMNWTDATINGGTFNGNVQALSYNGNAVCKASTLAINGGTFVAPPTVYMIAYDTVQTPTITVKEGVEIAVVNASAESLELEVKQNGNVYTLGAKVTGPTSWEDVGEETEVSDIVSEETAAELAGSTITASEIATWAAALAEKGVTVDLHSSIPVNALIFNVAPAAAPSTETEAAAADAILKDLASKVDISKMAAGTLDADTLALLEKEYPMATIKLVPSTKLESTETAKFFQLSIELK